MSLKELWQLVKAAPCFEYPKATNLEHLGERVPTLARLFNVREGFSRPADPLPARSNLVQPLAVGSAGGQVVDLEPMLDEYYLIMGWDPDGVPTLARLNDLGILDSLER